MCCSVIEVAQKNTLANKGEEIERKDEGKLRRGLSHCQGIALCSMRNTGSKTHAKDSLQAQRTGGDRSES